MDTSVSPSPQERLRSIENLLRSSGAVRMADLALEFGVSEMTIRRDLDELEALGMARRVRGGAAAVGPEPFSERHRHHARAKGKIAEKLIDLIPDRGTIALDASSTVHRLATLLNGARDLIVVTHSLNTFQALAGKSGIRPTLTGGSIEPSTGSLVGPVAVRTAECFMFDVFMCSCAALDATLGPSETSLEEADIKLAIGARSKRVVLALDHTKLGTRAQACGIPLGEVDLLVTDLDPEDKRLDPYRPNVELR